METVDELTVAYEENGEEVVKELDKHVLTKGAWATVAYVYQDRDRKTNDFGPPKITVRRYRKMKGVYRQQSKFNVSSMKQATELGELFAAWVKKHS